MREAGRLVGVTKVLDIIVMHVKLKTCSNPLIMASPGARGGAYGFRVSSLNKLTDTKASSNRSITLLHYIIRVCEKQWKDILRLDEDFPSVKEAAKVK